MAHFDFDSVECGVVTVTTFFISYLCAANKPLLEIVIWRGTCKGICFSSITIGMAFRAQSQNVIVFAWCTGRFSTTVIVEFPTLKTFRGIMIWRGTCKGFCIRPITISIAIFAQSPHVTIFAWWYGLPSATVIVKTTSCKTFRGIMIIWWGTCKFIGKSSITIGMALSAIGLNVTVFACRTGRLAATVIVEFPILKTFRGIMIVVWLHSFPVTPITIVYCHYSVLEEIVCDIFVCCNISFQCFWQPLHFRWAFVNLGRCQRHSLSAENRFSLKRERQLGDRSLDRLDLLISVHDRSSCEKSDGRGSSNYDLFLAKRLDRGHLDLFVETLLYQERLLDKFIVHLI